MSDSAASVMVQGSSVSGEDPEQLRRALSEAFEYRGDVTLKTRAGDEIEGFVFDHRNEITLSASVVRVLTPAGDRVAIAYPDIAEVRFTGRDAAAGRSWENWVRRYAEQKLAGEAAGIESEELD